MTQLSIVGVWRLVSYESRPESGATRLPYGERVSGFLIYTPEGYMSVAIMGANRPNLASEDRLSGMPDEYARAMKSYVSYCGRYTVRHDRVIHHIELSHFPNWCGVDQERFYQLEGDRMRMRTPPFVLGAVEQTAHLVWERVRAGE